MVPTLGPAYEGSRISRKDALQEEEDNGYGSEYHSFASGDHDLSDEDEIMSSVVSSEIEPKLENDSTNVHKSFDKSYSSRESVSDLQDDGYGSNDSVSPQSQDSSRSSVSDYGSDLSDEELSNSSGNKVDDDNEEKDEDELNSRAAVRQILQDEQKIVAADISRAVRADIEKGRAVKKQKAAFDSLLNVRLKMQKAVTAVNTLPLIDNENSPSKALSAEGTFDTKYKDGDNDNNMNGSSENHDSTILDAAEEAAIKLWKSLTALRDTLIQARNNSQKRKRKSSPTHIHKFSTSTPTETLWQHMQDQEQANIQIRHAILNKWSTRLRGTNPNSSSGDSNINNHRRLNPNSSLNPRQSQSSLSDLLTTDLTPNSTSYNRFLARAHTVRSCAPAHAARGQITSQDIYDDTDFYGSLLQTFLEQRSQHSNVVMGGGGGEMTMTTTTESGTNIAAGLAADRPLFFAPRWEAAKAAKVKKVVDTRASKGRKLKYTVHEKLQNFMAPENKCRWDERQTDELFGSLFGKKFMLDEEDDDESLDGDGFGQRGEDDVGDRATEEDGHDAGLLLYGR